MLSLSFLLTPPISLPMANLDEKEREETRHYKHHVKKDGSGL